MKIRDRVKQMMCIAMVGVSLAGMTGLTVSADASRVVTIGADLSDAQKEKIYAFFNTSETEAVVIEVNNADERKYLEGVVADSIIGTHTYSCAYIEPTTSGGVFVKTANLNWVTADMLGNALLTAGIENCNVLATAPFEVSGTGALTGVMMAYETATDTVLDEEKKQLANEELVLTAEMSEGGNEQDAVLEALNEIKKEVITDGVVDEKDVLNIVINVTNDYSNLHLTDEQIDRIVDLVMKFTELDYDKEGFGAALDNFKAQLTDDVTEMIGAKKEEMTDEAKNWLQKLWEAIVNFFKNLFSAENKEKVTEGVSEGLDEAKQKANDFFSNINTDVISFDGEADTDVNVNAEQSVENAGGNADNNADNNTPADNVEETVIEDVAVIQPEVETEAVIEEKAEEEVASETVTDGEEVE